LEITGSPEITVLNFIGLEMIFEVMRSISSSQEAHVVLAYPESIYFIYLDFRDK
jgi:hypothetical protein